jgi:hypothetical protein
VTKKFNKKYRMAIYVEIAGQPAISNESRNDIILALGREIAYLAFAMRVTHPES